MMTEFTYHKIASGKLGDVGCGMWGVGIALVIIPGALQYTKLNKAIPNNCAYQVIK